MRWTKLRQIVEGRVAELLRERVRLESTHYHRAHDDEGRAAIVIDGVQVWAMGCMAAHGEAHIVYRELREREGLRGQPAHELVGAVTRRGALHNQYEFHRAVWDYTQMSIDDALACDDAIIRSLAYMDARIGKRRLLAPAGRAPSTDIEKACLGARLGAEELDCHWSPTPPSPVA
jgi:hypothetical protein